MSVVSASDQMIDHLCFSKSVYGAVIPLEMKKSMQAGFLLLSDGQYVGLSLEIAIALVRLMIQLCAFGCVEPRADLNNFCFCIVGFVVL